MTLLNLSNLSLNLGKSTIYLRLSFLIQIFAIYLVWLSDFTLLIQLLTTILLLYQLLQLPNNSGLYVKLEYRDNKWLLFDKCGNHQQYMKHQILFDTGLFFVLQFSSGREKKKILVFYDQINRDAYRNLKRLEKIKKSEKSS